MATAPNACLLPGREYGERDDAKRGGREARMAAEASGRRTFDSAPPLAWGGTLVPMARELLATRPLPRTSPVPRRVNGPEEHRGLRPIPILIGGRGDDYDDGGSPNVTIKRGEATRRTPAEAIRECTAERDVVVSVCAAEWRPYRGKSAMTVETRIRERGRRRETVRIRIDSLARRTVKASPSYKDGDASAGPSVTRREARHADQQMNRGKGS
ncbi:hypothetical protein MRX96_016239 [Rhipicephalus microplus]